MLAVAQMLVMTLGHLTLHSHTWDPRAFRKEGPFLLCLYHISSELPSFGLCSDFIKLSLNVEGLMC